jgi:OOP family OmpA-OmpF porin
VAILRDRSSSYRTGRAVAEPGQALTDVLAAAAAGKATVDLGSFDGSASTVDWQRRASTDLGLRNPVVARRAQARLVACLGQAAGAAGELPQRAPGSDLLGAWAAAAERLGAGGARSQRLWMETDGLATVGCADLRRAAIGDAEAIGATLAACRRAGELPDLAGIDVALVGVGHPGAGQPLPSSVQLRWLQRYWLRLCQASRARSCTVATESAAPPSPSPAALHRGPASDPVVSFPAVTVSEGRFIVPASVLFATASAVIDPGAAGALNQVAAAILAAPGAAARIDAYTDGRGGAAYNLALSRRRAAAVATALVAAGVPASALATAGHGAADTTGERRPDGGLDPLAMAKHRKVVVTVHPKENRQ